MSTRKETYELILSRLIENIKDENQKTLIETSLKNLFNHKTKDSRTKEMVTINSDIILNSIEILHQISKLNIDFSPHAGFIHLVPKGDKLAPIVSAKAFISIIARQGYSLICQPVYKGEAFKCDLANLKIKHEYAFQSTNEILGVYCIAKQKDKIIYIEIMSQQEINQIKGMAKTSLFWDKHYVEMAKKTVIRKISKYLPSIHELDNLNLIDNQSYNEIKETKEKDTKIIVDETLTSELFKEENNAN